MQVWDQAVTRKQAELGYPSIPFNELTYDQRIAMEDASKDEDVSVGAFLAWSEEQYNQGAAERFEESLQEPLTNEQALEIVKRLWAIHHYPQYPDSVYHGTGSSGGSGGSGPSGGYRELPDPIYVDEDHWGRFWQYL